MTQAVNLAALGSYGGVLLPSWTTAARPTPAYTGQQGYNTTLGTAEFYNGTSWVQTKITSGTAVASTSGTSIDFTGIPSWVKRITVMFNGVSTNGSSLVIARLGTSGGIVSTGYASSVAYCGTNTGGANTTVGLIIANPSASDICSGQLIISNISGNTWVASGTGAFTTNVYTYIAAGNSPALASVLTTVRITTVNGTDTFDAGSINILYE